MSCPPGSFLAAELAGMLTPGEGARLALHVNACPSCAAARTSVKALLTPKESRQAAAQAAFSATCEAALGPPRPPAAPPPRARPRRSPAAVASVAAALALLALTASPRPPAAPTRQLRVVAELEGAGVLAAIEALERADQALAIDPRNTAAAAERRRALAALVPVDRAQAPRPPAKVLVAGGRALWHRGVDLGRQADLEGAIAAYRQALAVYEPAGDVESSAWLHFLVGEAQGYMGLAEAGWRERQTGLATLLRHGYDERAGRALVGSAMLALFEGRPHVARELLDVALARGDGKPYAVANVWIWRSRADLALGDVDGAAEDQRRATWWAVKAPPEHRRELSGHLELAEGLLASRPEAAIAAFTRSIDAFEATSRPIWIPGVLLERARANLQLGAVAAADADLRRGTELLARQPAGGGGDLWAARCPGIERLVDERVRLALASGRGSEALAIAEKGRAWSLNTAQPHCVGDVHVARWLIPASASAVSDAT